MNSMSLAGWRVGQTPKPHQPRWQEERPTTGLKLRDVEISGPEEGGRNTPACACRQRPRCLPLQTGWRMQAGLGPSSALPAGPGMRWQTRNCTALQQSKGQSSQFGFGSHAMCANSIASFPHVRKQRCQFPTISCKDENLEGIDQLYCNSHSQMAPDLAI